MAAKLLREIESKRLPKLFLKTLDQIDFDPAKRMTVLANMLRDPRGEWKETCPSFDELISMASVAPPGLLSKEAYTRCNFAAHKLIDEKAASQTDFGMLLFVHGISGYLKRRAPLSKVEVILLRAMFCSATEKQDQISVIRLQLEAPWSISMLTIKKDGSIKYSAKDGGNGQFSFKGKMTKGPIQEAGVLSQKKVRELSELLEQKLSLLKANSFEHIRDGYRYTLTVETTNSDPHVVHAYKGYVSKELEAVIQALENAWTSLGKELIWDPGT